MAKPLEARGEAASFFYKMGMNDTLLSTTFYGHRVITLLISYLYPYMKVTG